MFSKTIGKAIYSNRKPILGFMVGSSVVINHYNQYKPKNSVLFYYSSENNPLKNDFDEFSVEVGKRDKADNTSKTHMFTSIWEAVSYMFYPQLKSDDIHFPLSEKHDAQSLPYADFLTPEKLKEMKTTRINQARLFWRGTNRSAAEIYEAGGFHPNCLKSGNEKYMRSPEEIFNVNLHNDSSYGSGLVSFTASKETAKIFGKIHSKKDGDYYVYLVKTVGALSTSSHASAQLESEYYVPGGVDKDSIVSYRKYNKTSVTHHSIFVSKKFIAENPEHVDRVLRENLEEDEMISKTNNRGWRKSV